MRKCKTKEMQISRQSIRKKCKENRVSDENKTDGEPSTPSDNLSASATKISKRSSTVAEGCKVTGYRFIDVEILGPFPTDDLQRM